ncbi:MAG: ArnT family glycosyltransferase [Anaerolineae bacterium]
MDRWPLLALRNARPWASQPDLFWSSFGAALAPLGLALWGWAAPTRPLSLGGARALLDAAFACLLTAYLLLLASAVGRSLGARLWQGVSPLESALFATAAGLGVLSHGILVLGAAGLATRPFVVAALALCGVAFARPVGRQACGLARALQRVPGGWRNLTRPEKAVALLAGAVVLLTFLLALAPPSGYDSLMYHLFVPRRVLESGSLPREAPDGNWHAVGPLGEELLFLLCLALGSDTAPQALHVGAAVLCGAVAFALARRYGSPGSAWRSVGVLLTMPVLPLWASQANVDFFWAFYEGMAVYALLLWWEEPGDARPLALAGALSGLALSAKVLALPLLGILAVVVLGRGALSLGKTAAVRALALYLCIALAVASPWYLKNWAYLHNPVYPFYLGARDLSPSLLRWIEEYNGQGFGVGRGWADWLLLPWNLYTHHAAFSASHTGLDYLSPLFPLLVLLPFVRRGQGGHLDRVFALVIGLRFAAWAVGSQQTRFLLPLFPLLCAAVGQILVRPQRARWRALRGDLVVQAVEIAGLGVGVLFTSLAFLHIEPLPVLAGLETPDAFLRRNVGDYGAMAYLREHAPPGARLFLVADGRGYYCPVPCQPDFSQGAWLDLVETLGSPEEVSRHLQGQGFSHILVSWEDLDFLLQHDPQGRLLRSVEVLVWEFIPRYLDPVYNDSWATLYQWKKPRTGTGAGGIAPCGG